MTAPRFDDLVIALGKEFQRRRMTSHLQALRRFYRARQRRALVQALGGERPWDENLVMEWLAIFRIAPFERIYVVQPPQAPCPRCGQGRAQGADVDYRAVFPGGSLQECRGCRTAWLIADPTGSGNFVRGPGATPRR